METAIVVAITAVVTLLLTMAGYTFMGGRMTGSVAQRLKSIEHAIVSLQADFKRLSDVLIELATVRGEIRALDQRIGRAEDDIREIRHGEGFVLPIFPKTPPGGG